MNAHDAGYVLATVALAVGWVLLLSGALWLLLCLTRPIDRGDD